MSWPTGVLNGPPIMFEKNDVIVSIIAMMRGKSKSCTLQFHTFHILQKLITILTATDYEI